MRLCEIFPWLGVIPEQATHQEAVYRAGKLSASAVSSLLVDLILELNEVNVLGDPASHIWVEPTRLHGGCWAFRVLDNSPAAANIHRFCKTLVQLTNYGSKTAELQSIVSMVAVRAKEFVSVHAAQSLLREQLELIAECQEGSLFARGDFLVLGQAP